VTFRQEMERQMGNRAPMAGLAERAPGAHRGQLFQLAVLAVAVAVAAAVVGWLLIQGESDSRLTASPSGPALVSQTQLENLASSSAQPVYWAGPRNGFSYELTRTADGRTYVRYLPHGVAAGDPRAEFLAVGTYERSHAFSDLRHFGTRTGVRSVKLDRGGVLVSTEGRPHSVYFSYSGASNQIEVFAPSGVTARALVLDGEITPIR
jgi:hypothetical protein